MTANEYLIGILNKYAARDLSPHFVHLSFLKATLREWGHTCFVETLDSGSRAKGTAIALASDVDYLISLTDDCNENSGGLEGIFESLHSKLNETYKSVRRQNVSVRINLNGLEVDLTPARRQKGSMTDHWVFLSKSKTRRQTNIQRHILDISNSGRTREIKVLKIWRELNGLDFPSIYLEYLVVQNILRGRSTSVEHFGNNSIYLFQQLAKDVGNPMFSRIVDPANSTNILSDLLSDAEKKSIIAKAKVAASQTYWANIIA